MLSQKLGLFSFFLVIPNLFNFLHQSNKQGILKRYDLIAISIVGGKQIVMCCIKTRNKAVTLNRNPWGFLGILFNSFVACLPLKNSMVQLYHMIHFYSIVLLNQSSNVLS